MATDPTPAETAARRGGQAMTGTSHHSSYIQQLEWQVERLRAQNEAYASQQDQWTRVVTAHTAELERLRDQNKQMLAALRIAYDSMTAAGVRGGLDDIRAGIAAMEGKP